MFRIRPPSLSPLYEIETDNWVLTTGMMGFPHSLGDLMQDNRFQSSLVTVLAIGFGAASAFAISSQTAQGYPAGAAVSYGANPVWSAGGVITGDGNALVIEAPSDQTVVFTDISISLSSPHSSCSTVVEAGLGNSASSGIDSANLGRFTVGVNRESYGYTRYHPIQTVNLTTGGQINAGDQLKLYTDVLWDGYCYDEVRLNYTISGYYAQP